MEAQSVPYTQYLVASYEIISHSHSINIYIFVYLPISKQPCVRVIKNKFFDLHLFTIREHFINMFSNLILAIRILVGSTKIVNAMVLHQWVPS